MGAATLLAVYNHPLIVGDSADFDGANDYMARGAGLTGAADSKTGILSMWLRVDASLADTRPFVSVNSAGGGTVEFRSQHIGAGSPHDAIRIIGENAAGTILLNILTGASAFPDDGVWRHFLSSWDLANNSSHIYVSDVSNQTVTTRTDDTIDYTQADWGIGGKPDGNEKFSGCIAELYFAPGQYLDLSLVSNRRKFISASGKPVHLGATGSLPTGTAPLIYTHLDDGEAVANFATNRGTGGNFLITGTLDTGATSPSD